MTGWQASPAVISLLRVPIFFSANLLQVPIFFECQSSSSAYFLRVRRFSSSAYLFECRFSSSADLSSSAGSLRNRRHVVSRKGRRSEEEGMFGGRCPSPSCGRGGGNGGAHPPRPSPHHDANPSPAACARAVFYRPAPSAPFAAADQPLHPGCPRVGKVRPGRRHLSASPGERGGDPATPPGRGGVSCAKGGVAAMPRQ